MKVEWHKIPEDGLPEGCPEVCWLWNQTGVWISYKCEPGDHDYLRNHYYADATDHIPDPPEPEPIIKPKIWSCKIGEVNPSLLPPGSDSPMREAVEAAYLRLTGLESNFNFSGWGAELDCYERAVFNQQEDRRKEMI